MKQFLKLNDLFFANDKKIFFFEAWIFKLNLIVIQFIWGENIFKKKCVAVLSLLIVFFICLSSVNAMDLNDTFANCNNANFNHEKSMLSDVSDDVLLDDSTNDVEIYVNNSVDISGDGSKNNPYKTINEAVNVVTENHTTVIHIASGMYNITDNGNMTINFNHKNNNSLSFSGYGDTQPIINGYGMSSIFLNVNKEANIFLKNLVFMNLYGADNLIVNNGNMFIINCDFKNNKFTNFGSLIKNYNNLEILNSNIVNNIVNNTGNSLIVSHSISNNGKVYLDIINSTFKSNNGNSIRLSNYYNSILNVNDTLFEYNNGKCIDTQRGKSFIYNSRFVNNVGNRGVALMLDNEHCADIRNCLFENNTANDKGTIYVYTRCSLYLMNNTIKNCSSPKDNGIYFVAGNSMSDCLLSPHYLTILDNSSVRINSSNIYLKATLTDDNGNGITVGRDWGDMPIRFYIDGIYVGSSDVINGTLNLNTKVILDGACTVSATFTKYTLVKNATLLVSLKKNEKIYIAEDGDDVLGDGSEDNPYKTIEKGFEVASSTYDSTIYIKCGDYFMSNPIDCTISGLSLTIIGYDGQVTINMDNKNIFTNIGANCNLKLYNLSFVNGKGKYGSSSVINVLKEGSLIVDNCTFKDNQGYYAGAIHSVYKNIQINNSIFINNGGNSANSIYASGFSVISNSIFYGVENGKPSVYSMGNISNCTFIKGCAIKGSGFSVDNSTFINCSSDLGGSIHIDNNVVNLNNNRFINSSATSKGAAIYMNSGELYLTNNTVINCVSPKDNYVYVNGGVVNNAIVSVLDNKTVDIESFGVTLKAKILDDNGNLITVDYLSFYLNDELIEEDYNLANGEYVLNYKKLLNGTYLVSAGSDNLKNYTVKTATLKITPLMNREIYVAIDGNDEIGDGSKDKPYKTIEKGISEANAYNNIIYIGEGMFNLSTALEINAGEGNFTMAGCGDKTIINLNKNGGFIDDIFEESHVNLMDLCIINTYKSNSAGGAIVNNGNLIIDNVSFINATAAGTRATVRGGAIYNTGYLYIINSKFVNTTAKQGGVIYNTNYLYLKNNTMINPTASVGKYVLTTGVVDNVILNINNNCTSNISENSFTVNATVTDDMNHPITATAQNNNVMVKFLLNGNSISTAYLKDGIVTSTINMKLNGNFILNGTFGTSNNVIVKTAVLNFNNSQVLNDVWVSVNGDDINGNGSKDNPVATLSKALTLSSFVGATIHIVDGVYNTSFININHYGLSIIGEGNNVQFNSPSSFFRFYHDAHIINLNFINLDMSKNFIFDAYGDTLTIDNCKFINITCGYDYGIIKSEAAFAGINILNCTFENISGTYKIGQKGFLIYSDGGDLNIVDSKFNNITYNLLDSNMPICSLISISNEVRWIPPTYYQAITTACGKFINCEFSNIYGIDILSINSANADIDNCNFVNISGNKVISLSFSVLDKYDDYNVTIANSVFELINSTDSCVYKGIRLLGGQTGSMSVMMINNTFKNNFASKYIVSVRGYEGAAEIYLGKFLINDSIFINNVVNSSEGALISVNSNCVVDVYNSVVINNLNLFTNNQSFVYLHGSGKIIVDNNWWGNNTSFEEIISQINGSGYVLTNWVVAELFANVSDIHVGDVVELTITFKSSNGSTLANFVPTRLAEFLGNVTFNGLNNITVKFVNNFAHVVGIAATEGKVTAIVDKQVLSLNITKSNTSLVANNLTVGYGNMILYNVSISDVNQNPIKGATITIDIDGQKYSAISNDEGVAIFNLGKLNVGKYNIKISFSENNQYFGSSSSNVVIVNQTKTIIIVRGEDINVGENALISAVITDGVTGDIVFKLGNITKTATIMDGNANVTFDNLDYGDYTVSAKYGGNANYLPCVNSTIFSVSKMDSSIKLDNIKDILVGETVVIRAVVTSGVTGNVTFVVGNKQYIENITDGGVTLTINDLLSGNYSVKVSYNGDNKYLSSEDTTEFIVSKVSDYKINVNVSTLIAGESATLEVFLPNDAHDNVTIVINNKHYTATVLNGSAKVVIAPLNAGKYNVTVIYSGDEKYVQSSIKFNVTVNINKKVNLNISDIVMIYKDGTRMVAVLTDYKGNPIVNATVYFSINGVTYVRFTDANGSAYIGLNLGSGVYGASVYYNGSDMYDKVSKNITVTINPTIVADDLVKMYQNDTRFYAKFTDSTGKALANTEIKFNIHGVFYTKKTDKDGVADMSIMLRPGSYILTAYNPVTGEEKGFNITVKSLIMQNDLTKYYLNASKFEATVYNKDGSLAVNKEVTFNINGVFYHKKTDENGVASLGIALRPGNYTITTMYDGLDIGNKVTVLPTLVTKDLSMKYLDGSNFTALTLDGQGKPLANQNVSFNVNGVFYHKVTNKDGIASLGIRLMAGEYIITSYWNDFQTGNTIKINP